MPSIIHAIILAAGQGRRLLPYTQDRPKCLLDVGGKTILERQVEALRSCHVDHITVVTGYLGSKVRDVLGTQARYTANTDFETTSSMYSLWLARHAATAGCIILMQPWQPFPQRYAYQRNPVGRVWSELERTADAAGYQVFRAERPSAQYRALIDQLGTAAGGETAQRSPHRPPPRAAPDALCELIAATEARTILDYGLGAGHDTSAGLAGLLGDQAGPAVTRASVVSWPLTERLAERFDGVVCAGMLAYLPDEDVPWVLDELFGYATRFVSVTMTQPPPCIMLPGGTRLRPRL